MVVTKLTCFEVLFCFKASYKSLRYVPKFRCINECKSTHVCVYSISVSILGLLSIQALHMSVSGIAGELMVTAQWSEHLLSGRRPWVHFSAAAVGLFSSSWSDYRGVLFRNY